MHKGNAVLPGLAPAWQQFPSLPPAEPRQHQGFVVVLGLFLSSVTELGPGSPHRCSLSLVARKEISGDFLVIP